LRIEAIAVKFVVSMNARVTRGQETMSGSRFDRWGKGGQRGAFISPDHRFVAAI